MAINIIDGSVKGNRQYICEPMIQYVDNTLKLNYKGIVGMNMSQRPNTCIRKLLTKQDDETTVDFTNRVSVFEKKVVASVPFIEPIFIFSNKDMKLDYTLLNKNNIEDLFE